MFARMFVRNFIPSCLVGTAIVMTASPVRAATDALLPTEVAEIAKSTVVRIETSKDTFGSGVIVGYYREGRQKVYVVLTAAHVVRSPSIDYWIITPPKQSSLTGRKRRQKIAIRPDRDIQNLPGLDLAIVKFRSDRNYDTATLGNSDYTTEGAGVYIAGFPNPGMGIRRRVFQFTSSLVSARLDGEEVEGEIESGPVHGGYAIIYTNVTRAGMSGGPVFDVSGRVIGIHGMGDADRIPGVAAGSDPGTESGPTTTIVKTGFNLGIPSASFLNAMSPNLVRRMGIELDESEPGLLQGGGLFARRGGSHRAPPPINIVEEDVYELEEIEEIEEVEIE